jgi:hypothetical protein
LCNSPFFHPKPPPIFSGFKCNSPKFFPDLSGTDYVNFRTSHDAPPQSKSHTPFKKSGIGPALVHPDRAISIFPDLSPPYTYQLTATLRDLRTKRKKQALKNGWGSVPNLVFVNSIGQPIDLDNWRTRIFNKALEKAELRRIRIHDLRHTYATLRISKGDNIQDVSNQLGHHSTKLTLDVYSHWMPGKKKAEVDALDDQDFLQLPSAPPLHPEQSENKKRVSQDQLTR